MIAFAEPIITHLILHVFSDPAKRLQFKQFVNTPERRRQTELIEERGQKRPADWPKTSASLRFMPDQFVTPKRQWTWQTVGKQEDIMLNDQATASIAVKYGDTQLAVYYVPRRGLYASQQMYASYSPSVPFLMYRVYRAWCRCPHRRAFVLDQGIIGDTPGGDPVRYLLFSYDL